MGDLYIDRLILEMPGGSAADGRRVAEAVGRLLTAADVPATAAGRASLRVDVPAAAADDDDGNDVERTARRIAAAVLDQLA